MLKKTRISKKRSGSRHAAYRWPKRVGRYRSQLEASLAEQIEKKYGEVLYEESKISYEKPSKVAKYTPDFELPNGIYVEGKGIFTTEDRAKHLLIREQKPHLDIRFVFTRSNTKLSRGSKTTYADWCNKHGFLFADKRIPMAWLDEPPRNNNRSISE